jgi:endonuclease/exonuclease/phosphatase family metal-dependent hydrolase
VSESPTLVQASDHFPLLAEVDVGSAAA